ncbi:MAG: cupin domain-containing protein [Nanoarchaeota archaeon]|nr:cupin domain-containing protein [Nanoarchaeota archaeon]
MKIVNMKDLEIVKGCGKLKELYGSDNLNLAYTVIKECFKPHKHEKTEEVYFIVKGKGKIKIGDKVCDVKDGDVIPIPKNEYHCITEVSETIELIAVCYPGFDESDMIY